MMFKELLYSASTKKYSTPVREELQLRIPAPEVTNTEFLSEPIS